MSAHISGLIFAIQRTQAEVSSLGVLHRWPSVDLEVFLLKFFCIYKRSQMECNDFVQSLNIGEVAAFQARHHQTSMCKLED